MTDENSISREDRYRELSAFVDAIKLELGRVVIGQSYMVERLLIGLLTGGHVLLEGVPGLAKTLTVKSLAECLDLQFSRIQFTPDLLPADLIGTMIFDPQSRDFVARRGPVFTNVLLADEINRAPAKVQSALLECMQERQVTLGDSTTALPKPFLVLATQNPIEQEGTYPLPEAQIDRFMLMIRVGYPTRSEERKIMELATETVGPIRLTPSATAEQILAAQQAVRDVRMTNGLKDYIVDIICATRNPAEYGIKSVQDYIEFGASPRATIYLNLAAKAHAFLRGSEAVFPDDIKAVAYDVLRHRVIPTYEAEADGMTPEKIIEKILETIKVP